MEFYSPRRSSIARIQIIRKMALFLSMVSVVAGIVFGTMIGRPKDISEATFLPKRTMTVKELAGFDGNNPERPIYLALDGFIYDVSAGRRYYAPDGVYHYLAGKDASPELHIAGGEIIKRKYPVVAIFTP